MTAVLVFAVTLLIAVLVSELAQRSVLSTSVLFLLAGFLAGDGVLGIVPLGPKDPVIKTFAELALFSVLFTDGMRVGLRDVRSAWHLPGRALLFGMPLVLLGTALLARYLVGLPWVEALLLGAALSPTDPVFAAAIVGRDAVPLRLRRLLNVESGLNDGLALPIVVTMLSLAGADSSAAGTVALEAIGEVAKGVGIGIVVPWVALKLEQSRFFKAAALYEPLNGFAIGLLVLSISKLAHGNDFLGAFAAGITVATVAPSTRDAFHRLGETLAELLKLAGLLVFGAFIAPHLLVGISWQGYLFVILALTIVRPLALRIALARAGLGRREWATAAWFGPKGFATIFFGLLILKAKLPQSEELFELLALVVSASIVVHSSTDVFVARWFKHEENASHQQAANAAA